LSLPPDVAAAHGRLKRWLLEDAYPIWWERGADHAHGGFHDRFALDGTPVVGPKRVRVQARQAWAYALAPGLGWSGPSEAACRHGLKSLAECRQGDGLYRSASAPAYADLDGMGELYDQAFALLALAAGFDRFGEAGLEVEALRLRERLAVFAHPLGGYAEAPGLKAPLFANPNMHLFESFIAWSRISGDPVWGDAAVGQAELALKRLIDPYTQALGEAFGPGWTEPADPTARAVWPGHMFEWAWLLMRWPGGGHEALAAALRLVEIDEACGVDAGRSVAIFALNETLTPRNRGARLWSQTERIKAVALAASVTGDSGLWNAAARACEGLEAFLDVPTPGLWRDWMDEAGRFREEPAPASSFYHIVGAIAELERLAAEGA
jgi:mannose/cellobiose epimerase-like protein (N-acyl-D-glucosamine 2-epimerase family)